MDDLTRLGVVVLQALFPLLTVGTVGVLWWMGVFGRGYLRAGPRRRVSGWPWVGWIGLALVAVSPLIGPIPAAGLFMILAVATPDGARQLGVSSGSVPAGTRSGVGRTLLSGAGLTMAGLTLSVGVGTVAMGVAQLLGDPQPMAGHDLLRALAEDRSGTKLAQVVLSAVVAAPLIEEFCYRGVGQTVLVQWFGRSRRWAVVVGVALFFSLIHAPVVSPYALPSLFVLGLVFGAAYERAGSIWICVMTHAGFNAANVAMVVLLLPVEGQ